MVRLAFQALRMADLAVVMVDAEAGLGIGDRFVIRETETLGLPRIMLINKIDRVRKSRLLPLIDSLSREEGFAEIVPISALTGDNCDRIEAVLLRHLPQTARPPDPEAGRPDRRSRFEVAEMIREKVLLETREELPHSTAVLIEAIETRSGATWIHATLIVERDSQKRILIGRQGAKLRSIGEAARRDLEGRFGDRIVLKLWVRAVPDWRGDDRVLARIGLPSGK
jgi:GTP-binding protein Era